MNIKETPHGEPRLFQNETLVHMFLECSVVEPFWKDVIDGGISSVQTVFIPVTMKSFTATNLNLRAFTRR